MSGKQSNLFQKFSEFIAYTVGTSWAFIAAVTLIILWALSGPIFHFSDTWQLVINTGTTIITFLMVFLIQNTQNRDTQAINLKLDEIIMSSPEASNDLVAIDNMSQQELTKLHKKVLEKLANQSREELK